MHLVASTTVWYAARAGGVVSYVLVSASVLAGILLAGKKRVPGLPRFAVEDVHRFLGLLAGLFIAIHVGSIALDTVVPFSLTQLVLPFTSSYRPLATGLGIVAVELLACRGGDESPALAPALPGLAPRALRDARRVAPRHGPWHPQRHRPQPDLAAGGVRHHRRAGGGRGRPAVRPRPHPATARHRARRRGRRAASSCSGSPPLPQQASKLEGSDQGRRRDHGPRSRTARSPARSTRTTARASSRSAAPPRRSRFRIDLLTGGNTVADTALQLRFASGTICEGTLTALDDTGFTGTCTLPGGGTRTVTSTWTVSNGTVDGTISTTGGSSTSTDA